jgi:hypothetical protein
MIDAPTNPPRPDLDQARDFLKALDPQADRFTLQAFPEKGKAHLCRLGAYWGNLSDVADIVRYHDDNQGIYCSVNETDGLGRGTANMVRVRAVFCEADGGEPVDFPLKPSWINRTSPRHFHYYWFVSDRWLADDQGKAEFDAVMERMVRDYGCDKCAKSIEKVLRVPGFLHRKSDQHHLVTSVDGNGRRYPRAEILHAFPRVERPSIRIVRSALYPQASHQRIEAALRFIDPHDRDTWLQVGMGLKDELGEGGRYPWDSWSQRSDKFDPRDQETAWRSFGRTCRQGITIRTVFYYAKRGGWIDPNARRGAPGWAAD